MLIFPQPALKGEKKDKMFSKEERNLVKHRLDAVEKKKKKNKKQQTKTNPKINK